jgi:autotransporter strand-loop-strand O-heptosyltransferase
MKSRGIKVYTDSQKNKTVKIKRPLNFKFTFDYGPKVDTIGNDKGQKAKLKFTEKGSSEYSYLGDTSPGLFTTLYRKWFTPWIVETYDGDEKIWEHDFEQSLYRAKICVSLDSRSLGDTLAWLPVVDKFREKYQADLYATTFWNPLVTQMFPGIRFLNPGHRENDTVATFGVGWYEEDDTNLHKRDPRTVSLQQIAGDILGIDVNEDIQAPCIPTQVIDSKPFIQEKYVCLATESTANTKHWHFPGGWQTIVDYLNGIGYKVVVIHEQENTLNNVIDKTGSIDIMERAIDLYHADFMIGIGSGVPWLAWSLRKPVVMISGFSSPYCEFSNKNYRIINQSVCNGCFNDVNHKFDRGDWNWCPRLKGTERMFECSTKITPDMVQNKIQELIATESL